MHMNMKKVDIYKGKLVALKTNPTFDDTVGDTLNDWSLLSCF